MESQGAELCFGNGQAKDPLPRKNGILMPDPTDLNKVFFGLQEADFPGGPAVKNPPCCAGDAGSIPGWGC